MFPYGFVDRNDQSDIRIVSAPLIKKVGKCSYENGKNDTGQSIKE